MPVVLKPKTILPYTCFILGNILFTFLPFNAQAAAITNLSKESQAIEVYSGNETSIVIIDAGRTLRVLGSLKIRYGEYDMRIEAGEEYALWPNGYLGPQRSANFGSGVGFLR